MFVIRLVAAALFAVGGGDRELLCFLVLLNDLELEIFGEFNDFLVLGDDGEIVAALMAKKSISLFGVLDHEHFETQRAKLHYYLINLYKSI